jgi:phage shock protein C
MTSEARKLYRSRKSRVISGVCGGLGEYLNIDPTVIRLVFVLLTVISLGYGLFIYLVMLLIIPEEPERSVVPEVKEEPPQE